jgi:hypothetical protein
VGHSTTVGTPTSTPETFFVRAQRRPLSGFYSARVIDHPDCCGPIPRPTVRKTCRSCLSWCGPRGGAARPYSSHSRSGSGTSRHRFDAYRARIADGDQAAGHLGCHRSPARWDPRPPSLCGGTHDPLGRFGQGGPGRCSDIASAALTLTVYGHMFDEDLDALANALIPPAVMARDGNIVEYLDGVLPRPSTSALTGGAGRT